METPLAVHSFGPAAALAEPVYGPFNLFQHRPLAIKRKLRKKDTL